MFKRMSVCVGLFLAASVTAAPPPQTKVEAVTDEVHGQKLTDNYRWLEALETESEDVKAWTTQQNDYTRGILDGVPFRRSLEHRLSELMTIGSVSAPAMCRNRYFYTERRGEENQGILYVREGYNGEPRVLINPNTLDEKGLYSLDWYVPTEDGMLLAFGLSYAGSEMTVLYVMDVDSGKWMADEIPGKIDFSGWSPDKNGFLYGKLEDEKDAYSRSYRYHVLGTHHRQDPMLFKQDNPSRIPFAGLSKDGRWFVSGYFEGWAKQDLYAADADAWRRTGKFEPKPVAVGLNARFTPEVMTGDTMYMFTTLDAPNGKIVAVDMNNPDQKSWKTVIAERPGREGAVLQGLTQARGLLVATYEKNAATRIERFTMDGTSMGEVTLPGAGLGSAGLAASDDRTEAFISYTSFNEPTGIYRIDLAKKDAKPELWARPEVPVDPSVVDVKQVFFSSKDGTQVPMFIVHKKGLKLDGNNPCLLYGYGGFNISMTPAFSATNFPWFERGGVYALVNLRGGGEYGEAWHQAGMLGNKQNVFDDLFAGAEYLISSRYTSAKKLAVMGGSNGGLLTGVAMTQRPDLFAAVVCGVPLLDMLRYQNFLMAKFWVPEYGSADDAEQFKWLKAYSPYHNIKKGVKYPAILFTAGENDSRVHPLHARKMAAAMQAMASNNFDEDPIMMWVDREAGHGQGKPLALRIRDTADRWSFIMTQTGMEYPSDE